MNRPTAYRIDLFPGTAHAAAVPANIAALCPMPANSRVGLIAANAPVQLRLSSTRPMPGESFIPYVLADCGNCGINLCSCPTRFPLLWEGDGEPLWAWTIQTGRPACLYVIPDYLEDPEKLLEFKPVCGPKPDPFPPKEAPNAETPPEREPGGLRPPLSPPGAEASPPPREAPQGDPEVDSLVRRFLRFEEQLQEIERLIQKARTQSGSALHFHERGEAPVANALLNTAHVEIENALRVMLNRLS